MAKQSQVRSWFVTVSILAAAAGCGSHSNPTGPAPTSPDAGTKDITKNASGTSAPGTGAGSGSSAAGGVSSPKSPDMMNKDVTKAVGVGAAGGANMTPMKAPDYKDATHTLGSDEPWFKTSPAADTKPDGILAAGSPVLVVIPGETYSLVKLGNGAEAYVGTAALKPTGK